MGWRLESFTSLNVVDEIITASVLGNISFAMPLFVLSACMYANCPHTGLNICFNKKMECSTVIINN